jgi:hypothetical protein
MGPDIGALGATLLFLSVTIAQILLSLIVLSYAGYSFLLVLTSTAAGDDEVIWPGDPLVDWIWNGWYLAWLLAIWAVPASLLAGLLGLRPSSLPFLLVVAGVLWLLLPVSLLSSLSAVSRMLVLRPAIIRLLLRHAGATSAFYLATGILVAVCSSLGYFAVVGPGLLLLPAAVVGAIGFLVYARLLGRIGQLITQSEPSKGTRRPEGVEHVQISDPWTIPEERPGRERAPNLSPRGPSKQPRKRKKPQTKGPERVHDPWAPPPETPLPKTTPAASAAAEDPYGPAEGTYDVAADKPVFSPPPSAPPFAELEDADLQAYGVSTPPEGGPPRMPVFVTPEELKREEELAAPRRPVPLLTQASRKVPIG